ncbi:Major Facilitator Superfamily protein [Corynebacterium cystitidis DSM 20524]|uniref:Predicted arabinose efflux permease, MFS family n=1 Tax=Corynebacterium cystitidis DSM 20524 TaxID=1121357 RepID=A0A1H9UHP1_9CORY|nr:Major Facilitator Superfamily protein [Corynebacterium cystitidis DSM 20524]SES08778.1 Predicted arabinose efflux permease, MFS family [Corynebacterium cystitidis DSM 20524]SNV91041.1 ABC-type transporter, permease component [Corynebacterium cystitidis]
MGLNLTIAALAAVEVTGKESLGGLAQTSTILGATFITIAATRISILKDRLFALRCTISVAALGSLVAHFAISTKGSNGWLLFVGLFLLGGGTVSALISRFTATEKVGQSQKAASAIGVVLFGSAIGSMIGPNIYGLISLNIESPMEWIFLWSALIFMIGLLALSFERRRSYSSEPPRSTTPSGSGRFIWNQSYVVIFAVGIIAHASMISLMTMAPIYTDRVFGPSGSGIVMTAHLLGMYALGPVVSSSLNRFGLRKTILGGATTFIISIFFLVFLHHSFILFTAGLFGVGVFWSVGMIASSTLASKVDDANQRIALQGRLDLAINIAAGVSSILSGFLVTMIGYPLLAALVFVLAFFAFVCIFLFKSRQMDRELK